MSLTAGQLSQATRTVGCRLIIKYLNGSGECLERAAAHYALPPRGKRSLGSPRFIVFVRGLFRRQQYRGLDREVVFFENVAVLFAYASPVSHAPFGVRRVRVQNPTYLGFRPADDLSVEFEGWATLCRIALFVERSLTRSPPPGRSVREEAEYSSAPLQGRTIYR